MLLHIAGVFSCLPLISALFVCEKEPRFWVNSLEQLKTALLSVNPGDTVAIVRDVSIVLLILQVW